MEKCNGNDLCQFIAFAEKDEKLGTSSLCVLYDRCEYVAVHKRFTIFEKGCKGNILENTPNYTVYLILLHTPSFLLEIRVIIKISKNPWYPINCD